MARSTQKFDVAEWYKRGMILVITVLVGIIAQDMSEMKGDVKVALKMTEINHVDIERNEDSIESLEHNTAKISSELVSHSRRLIQVETVLEIPAMDAL